MLNHFVDKRTLKITKKTFRAFCMKFIIAFSFLQNGECLERTMSRPDMFITSQDLDKDLHYFLPGTGQAFPGNGRSAAHDTIR